MSVRVKIGKAPITVVAEPLTPEGFAPFGDVISNQRRDVHPSALAQHQLPSNASSANQGSAIRYGDVSRLANHYAQAPSGTGEPKMSMFVCAARPLETVSDGAGRFAVKLLERHPFTTQTFTPLPSTASQYLVIVAPSLAPSALDNGLPVPQGPGLPGRGLPDVTRLRAFVAEENQAVTYGAGTWHAPMVVLGKEGTVIEFVVFQHASGRGIEDCQFAEFDTEGPGANVLVPQGKQRAKL
jgi:ureidoglycolate hydrolase